MKIVIASDHAGYALKQEIVSLLQKNQLSVEDLGCFSSTVSVDYPDHAATLAQKISSGEAERGILVCGTGVGMAITANKFPNVRAAALNDCFTTKLSREHNDLNVLCLGGRVLAVPKAYELVRVFLDTPFEGRGIKRGLEKLKKLKRKKAFLDPSNSVVEF